VRATNETKRFAAVAVLRRPLRRRALGFEEGKWGGTARGRQRSGSVVQRGRTETRGRQWTPSQCADERMSAWGGGGLRRGSGATRAGARRRRRGFGSNGY
jgi:hypothetical protein